MERKSLKSLNGNEDKLQELNESPEGVIEEYIWKIDTEFDKDFIERKISMVVGGLDEYFTERKISLKIE